MEEIKSLKDMIDEKGNFKKRFNPYRCEEDCEDYYNYLFDEHGDLNDGIEEEAYALFKELGITDYECDLDNIIASAQMYTRDNGGYGSVYYWRDFCFYSPFDDED